ncbi:uncharacterized protein LOC124930628 [Impatiens glandulifera]|uniref:uncharacterized protein LOC124930628 n=1 Tax=Impatiens glandulifera TaxID=253017 RepID=UPI001FB10A66|nr:uncharacterized protein LOC124930628 [Impatiens glandulifera]
MAISDIVAGNLTRLYLLLITAIKVYGLVYNRSFTGVFVLFASTATLTVLLIGTLVYDVSRKAAKALTAARLGSIVADRSQLKKEICRGGICWHRMVFGSPISQVIYGIPQPEIDFED